MSFKKSFSPLRNDWLAPLWVALLLAVGPIVLAHAENTTPYPEPSKEIAQTSKPKSSPAPVKSDNSAAREFATDEELVEMILEVRLRSFVLSDAMFAYLDRRGVLFIPLRDYVEMLDFPISVDSGGRRAGGWFLNENRLFSLQLDKGEVIIEGRRMPFDRTLVRQIYGDLFVDARLLAQWFPVDIDYDLANLMLNLTSREPLPLEQKLAREERRTKALGRKGGKGSTFDRVDNPYAWLGWPTIDSSLEFALNDDGTNQRRAVTHSTIATADIAKMHGEFYVSGSSSGAVSNARLKLSRKDSEGKLLGPMKATDFAFGDIVSPQLPLVSKTVMGRGATISNFPIGGATEFDRITLDGNLATGWEVELYRNEVLLDYRESQDDGRYVFEDVPLLFGVNNLRLVFYGPQGQTRQEIRQVRVGAGQVKPGQHHYRLSVNEHKRTLFEFRKVSPSDRKEYSHKRLFGQYETGINRYVSVAGHMASLPLYGNRHSYFGGGVRASVGNVYGGLSATGDVTGGWATKAAAQTAFFGTTVVAEHDRFFNYISEQTLSESDPLRHRTDVRLDGVARIDSLVHIPFNFTNRHEVTVSGDSSTSLSNRLSSTIGRSTVTNTTNWNYDKSATTSTATVNGNLMASARVWNLLVRGRLGYETLPRKDLTTASVSADWRINRSYNTRWSINSDLTEGGSTTYAASLNTRYKQVSLGFKVQYDTAHEYLAQMTMSFSLAKDPRGGAALRSTNMARGGLVSARVYQDNNFNRMFDEGDDPLQGVRFKNGRDRTSGETDENGVALIDGLPTDKPTDFEVDSGSLEDPYSIADPSGVSLALRPGVPAMIDFPVVSTGEIDGTVYRGKGDWASAVSDAVIQLIDVNGDVIGEVKSAFDGFYLFSFIRPGTYTLQVDPDQAARLNLIAPSPRQVEIKADGTVLSGEDFVYSDPAAVTETDRRFRVRLASFAAQSAADKEWADLSAEFGDAFRGLEPMIEAGPNPVDGTEAFTLYAAGLPSREAAGDLCDRIRAAKGDLWCNPMDVQIR